MKVAISFLAFFFLAAMFVSSSDAQIMSLKNKTMTNVKPVGKGPRVIVGGIVKLPANKMTGKNETTGAPCPRFCLWFCRSDGLCKIECKCAGKHNRRQKRAVGVQGKNIPLPADMDYYDLDDNDFLTLTELSLALKVSTRAVSSMFQLADRNRDGIISEWEFKRAPWDFERKSNVHTINCPNGGKLTVINKDSHQHSFESHSAESNEWWG